MDYKLGYVADRVGVVIMDRQIEKLIEFGVLANDIYKNLDECLGSLRGLEHKRDKDKVLILDDNGDKIVIHEPDTLVVYTTAILGENKHDDTYTAIIEADAVGIYSLLTKRLYKCSKEEREGIKVVTDSRKELQQVRKNQMAEVGRQKGGRRRDPIWKYQDEIIAMRKVSSLPVVIDAYSHIKGGTESTIRRILRGEK